MKGELQWNDAQVRFGEYDSKPTMHENEEEEFGASADLEYDKETFNFDFEVQDIESIRKISIELDGYESKSNITYCSTGLTMWKAAEFLCDHLVKQPSILDSKNILELGSGLGLCGILSEHLTDEKASIHMTDGDTDTLAHLRSNIQKNLGNSSSIECHQLLWSKENAETYLKHTAGNTKFDVILASDIIYNACVVDPMWETVKVLLADNGVYLFAFARRQVAVSAKDVLEAGLNAGFEYEECEETDPNEDLFVYKFRKKPSL